MVYVLSFYSNGELDRLVDGVYGVFSTYERACRAVDHHCEAFGLSLLDYDFDMLGCAMWRYFTNKGTYVIEEMLLDDEGAI